MSDGLVYIISAPSGSGKTTLTNRLLSLVPNLEFSISYTTRPPRGSEQHGREYFFVSEPEFERMIAAGEFLEHARVFGHHYGTARRFLKEAHERGNDLILDIDVQGAQQVKQRMPEAVGVFILPPSRETLEKRLRERSKAENVTAEDVIQTRLHMASREVENYQFYDYILVNDRLDQSIEELRAIVLAERIRRTHDSPTADDETVLMVADRCLRSQGGERLNHVLATFNLAPSRS